MNFLKRIQDSETILEKVIRLETKVNELIRGRKYLTKAGTFIMPG